MSGIQPLTKLDLFYYLSRLTHQKRSFAAFGVGNGRAERSEPTSGQLTSAMFLGHFRLLRKQDTPRPQRPLHSSGIWNLKKTTVPMNQFQFL